MRRFLLCAALVLLPAMGFAQDYDTGVAAYNAGDFAAALREWRPLAKQGNAAAQTNFGVMYVRGEGVPQDDAGAVKWYQLAADQGYALGQFSLGTRYSAGEGVPQDFVTAHMWLNLAVANGFSDDIGARCHGSETDSCGPF